MFLLSVEVVFDFLGDIDANVGVLARHVLAVVVGGSGTKGCGELVHEEGGHLREVRGVLLAALREEIHFL